MVKVSLPKGDPDVLWRAALEGKRTERELRECIRQAVTLLGPLHQLMVERILPDHDGPLSRGIREWLAQPAVQSALALEEADKGEG